MHTETTDDRVRGYLFATQMESHYVYFAQQLGPWRLGSLFSDASFLYCCFNAQGTLRCLALCGGSFVEIDKRLAFSTLHPVERFEWRKTGAVREVSCSDETSIDVLPDNSQLNL